jgi:predicted CopG family antitoxin
MGEGGQGMTKLTIAVSQEVADALKREGRMHESYDSVLKRLIAELKAYRDVPRKEGK